MNAMQTDFAVIFDMDGVLVDSNPAHKTSLKRFCEKYGYQLSDEQLRERIYGRTNKDWITNLFGELPKDTLKSYAEEKEALFREIFQETIAPVNGLPSFLKLLEKEGIIRAIATSAPGKNVDFTLKNIEVERSFFQAILDDSFVENGKPNPEIYLKTAQAIHFPPEKCIVFEDSLSGVQAAQSAGAKVIGITTTHTSEELSHTDLVISDFTTLKIDALKKLVG